MALRPISLASMSWAERYTASNSSVPGELCCGTGPPAMPRVRNRLRQRDAFLDVIFMAAAICLSCRPSAANSTIRARSTTRAGSERLRAHCCKAACWSAGKVMAGAIRIHEVSCLLDGRRTIKVVTYDALHQNGYRRETIRRSQGRKPKSSPRRRAWMQAPHRGPTERSGEVFVLDILSHRISAIEILRQRSRRPLTQG